MDLSTKHRRGNELAHPANRHRTSAEHYEYSRIALGILVWLQNNRAAFRAQTQ